MLFSDQTLHALIGVIDLKSNAAVHAVAGNRCDYQSVKTFRLPDGAKQAVAGDPVSLAACYRQSGVTSLYVADLDALQGGMNQWDALHQIMRHDTNIPLMLDLGLRDNNLTEWEQFLNRVPCPDRVTIILATESARDPSIIGEFLMRLPSQRVAVSFDFRDGQFVSRESTLETWLETCRSLAVSTAVAIDIAAVGNASTTTTSRLCKRIREALPRCELITGGGVRTEADAQEMFSSGADRLLVASAFLG